MSAAQRGGTPRNGRYSAQHWLTYTGPRHRQILRLPQKTHAANAQSCACHGKHKNSHRVTARTHPVLPPLLLVLGPLLFVLAPLLLAQGALLPVLPPVLVILQPLLVPYSY